MRKTIFLSIVAIVGLALHSCAPDPVYSYPPEYESRVRFTQDDPKTITLDNQANIRFVSSCNVGDSVTALIRVTYAGDNITSATYYWTLKDASGKTIEERSIEQIAPHKQKYLPMYTFPAFKDKGTYTVHFRAKFEYSAQAENGTLFGGYPTSANYEGAATVKETLRVE